MKLNIIVGRRKQRVPKLLNELQRQGITDYEFWDAIYLHSVKSGINAAHKQIVRYAQLAQWPEVCIAEDDLQFTNEKSWEYFLQNKPSEFDIYLSMVYIGEIYDGNKVRDWTGLTLYIVKSNFYEKFLSVPDEEHIDRELSKLDGDFRVCVPFVAKQYNGFSANTGKLENYDHLLRNRVFL